MPPPDLPQIANRLLILKAVVAHALAAPPRDFLNDALKRGGPGGTSVFEQMAETAREAHWTPLLESQAAAEISPQELAFAKSSFLTMTAEQQLNACWRIESCKALMWTVALIGEMGKAYAELNTEEWAQVTSISVERPYALNWVCGYAPGNRWDETPTDT